VGTSEAKNTMNTCAVRAAVLVTMMLSVAAVAQQASVNSPLLDHLAGNWVMRGTIAGQKTTHDINARWVLGHHYLQIHELSREKNSQGQPQYEATIFIGWNEKPPHYSCVWLDVYGGLSPASIGVAALQETQIPFVFKDDKGDTTFTNDFVYHAQADSWEWRMDNVEKGVAKPFGRVTLTRK
jgi:hypothetical protein